MYYPEPLDVDSPEYARVLQEQQRHDESRLDAYVNLLYKFALNSCGILVDGHFEEPAYRSLALVHGGTVAVYLECIRQNRHFQKLLLGSNFEFYLRYLCYPSEPTEDLFDNLSKFVDLNDIGTDDNDDSDDEDWHRHRNYQELEEHVMYKYKMLLIFKQVSEDAALAYGIPDNIPIHRDIQSVIDRALTKPKYAHFRDVVDGRIKLLTPEHVREIRDYWEGRKESLTPELECLLFNK